jgi:hypothetical protein
MARRYYEDIEKDLRQYLPLHFLFAEFLDEEHPGTDTTPAQSENGDSLYAGVYQTTEFFTVPAPKHISRIIQHIENCFGDEGK